MKRGYKAKRQDKNVTWEKNSSLVTSSTAASTASSVTHTDPESRPALDRLKQSIAASNARLAVIEAQLKTQDQVNEHLIMQLEKQDKLFEQLAKQAAKDKILLLMVMSEVVKKVNGSAEILTTIQNELSLTKERLHPDPDTTKRCHAQITQGSNDSGSSPPPHAEMAAAVVAGGVS